MILKVDLHDCLRLDLFKGDARYKVSTLDSIDS